MSKWLCINKSTIPTIICSFPLIFQLKLNLKLARHLWQTRWVTNWNSHPPICGHTLKCFSSMEKVACTPNQHLSKVKSDLKQNIHSFWPDRICWPSLPFQMVWSILFGVLLAQENHTNTSFWLAVLRNPTNQKAISASKSRNYTCVL